MEEYKRKYSEVSERLMERNRQYQKLQGLYDSLRLRNMVVGAGDREMPSHHGNQDLNIGMTDTLLFISATLFIRNTLFHEQS